MKKGRAWMLTSHRRRNTAYHDYKVGGTTLTKSLGRCRSARTGLGALVSEKTLGKTLLNRGTGTTFRSLRPGAKSSLDATQGRSR